ncbi:Sir2 family NAD-dependent protein deacetylase [Sulfurimonas sp. C5]|uniref:SIR2 family NAD-dependent protein deacylase n=1 Tax=Sulfurimonas sp. C5 TaxID=3036947 RepID=UPI002455DDD0|nr:Sir2 family NAD-dependent protein deacetylase [Sulfurimonas sp. C5]MDH4944829.1 Sir2 family NAD-dependent protein deacetylase [Sulfurimonas sp. C5]
MARVVVLSGAGISAESGLSTFRESDGLWANYSVEDICTAGCLVTNRDETISFYDKRRTELVDKEPNSAHKVLAELKNRYKNDIAIITQNVDNLFEKAGIAHEDVIHLHGFLTNVECEQCQNIYDIGYNKLADVNDGKCTACGSEYVRPYIVMFGEAAPNYALLDQEIQDCSLLVVIGTSGMVVGVNTLAYFVERSILNNLEPSDAINDTFFDKVIYDKATNAIHEIAYEIEELLAKG